MDDIICCHVHETPRNYLIEKKAIATSLKGESAIGALVELVARVWVWVDLPNL